MNYVNNPLRAGVVWNLVFGVTMLVYTAGLFIPIMEPDAAVYAQVSMEMHDRGDYLSIYHKGADWLDKPHFPFWMSALSYEVFGVNTVAYKLPAIIFILLGAFYTYLFGKKFYSPLHGWLAAIVLITAEHIIISNQDVRAEPFMTGLMIMALFHFASYLCGARCDVVSQDSSANYKTTNAGGDAVFKNIFNKKRNTPAGGGSAQRRGWFHLTLGSLALACLIMTKGLFTIIPIASGIGLALIYEKNWKAIFDWHWMAVIVMVFIFMSPALYGYYQQFDKHPEKTIFGEHNVSGVKFFLWTSQWGRFTNTGPIKGKGDITFFIHTMLWAFLPWAFAAFYALYKKIRELIRGLRPEINPPDQSPDHKNPSIQHNYSNTNQYSRSENYTFFGFITLFIIFSASRFQLSFYLNPLFPLLAILTTAMILNASKKVLKTFSVIHFVLSCLLVAGLLLLHYFFMDGIPSTDTIIIIIPALLIAFFLFSRRGIYIKKILFATALVVLSVNYYVNRDFYPELMKYQAESEAAYYMKENNIAAENVVFLGEMESVADVILHAPTKVISYDDVTRQDISGKYVFTSPEGRAKLNALLLNYEIIDEFEDFPVTRLNGKFINKRTRATQVETKYLLKVANVDVTKPAIEVTVVSP